MKINAFFYCICKLNLYLYSVERNKQKQNTMTKQEIKTNIKRLEATIKMNCWNKAYVNICKYQLAIYEAMLINM